MKLLELRLSDFACFSSRSTSLKPGINLIFGGNVSGKTTLIQALKSASTNKLAKRPSASAGQTVPAVAVRVEEGGKETLVERVFPQDSDDGQDKNPPLFPVSRADAVFFEGGGLLACSPPDLSRKLRSLALVEDDADQRLLPRLMQEYRRLTSRDPWGEDRDTPGELERIRERLAEIEFEWEDRLAALRQLGSLHVDPPLISAPAAVVDEVEPSAAGIKESEQSPVDELSDLAESLMQKDAEEDRWVPEDFPEGGGGDPQKVRERLWVVQKEAAALRQELVSVPSLSILMPSVLTVLFLVLGAVLLAFYRDLWQIVSIAGASLILFNWGVFVFLSRNKGSELSKLREQLSAAESERESLLQELDRLDELRRYGPDEDAMAAGEPAGEATSSDEGELPDDAAVDTPESQPEEAPVVSSWQQRRQLLAGVSDLRALEMEGETLRFREQEVSRRLKVLSTAIEMLFQAENRFSGKRREALMAAVNHEVAGLMPGASLRFEIDAHWKCTLLREGDAAPLAFSEFSRGERSLISLALHLGLLSLDGKPSLPFIADDLFDDLHGEWRDTAINGLVRFAQQHQVILTSREPELHNKALAAGWHVVSLDKTPSPPKRIKAEPAPERSDDEQQLHLL